MSLRQITVMELINTCGSVSVIDDETCVFGKDKKGNRVYLSGCVDALRELVVRGFVRNNGGTFTAVK